MPLMNVKTMPKETAAEVLQFLAEHEEFRAVVEAVGSDLAVGEVRTLLKELALELRREAAQAPCATYDATHCRHLTGASKQIISCLSPVEEKTLLSAFGLIEKAPPSPVMHLLRSERKS